MVYEWDEDKRLKNFEKHGYDLADGELSMNHRTSLPLVATGLMNSDG